MDFSPFSNASAQPRIAFPDRKMCRAHQPTPRAIRATPTLEAGIIRLLACFKHHATMKEKYRLPQRPFRGAKF
jgi:hypothetical protein